MSLHAFYVRLGYACRTVFSEVYATNYTVFLMCCKTLLILRRCNFSVCYPQHCAKRKAPVFNLLRGRFWGFRPVMATCCTDGGEIWRGGGDQSPLLHAKFHPHRCNDNGIGTPKLKFFLLRFDQKVQCTSVYPLRDFHKICRVWTPFQDVLAVIIWLDLLKGLWSYVGFKLTGSVYSQIFRAP